jgi:hypothetical protein
MKGNNQNILLFEALFPDSQIVLHGDTYSVTQHGKSTPTYPIGDLKSDVETALNLAYETFEEYPKLLAHLVEPFNKALISGDYEAIKQIIRQRKALLFPENGT